MIKIRDYKTYGDSLKTRNALITKVVLVYTEADLAKKIKEITQTDVVLMMVVPSADSNAPDYDNITEKNTHVFYVLMKPDRTDLTDATLLDLMEDTQDIIEWIKNTMIADKSICGNMMRFLEINNIHTDPEHDMSGCYGWSVSMNLKTIGF